MSVGKTNSFIVAETMEENGLSSLQRSVSGDYMVLTDARTLVLRDENGIALNLIEFPAHQFLQAEVIAGVMSVLVKDGNDGRYHIWSFDEVGTLSDHTPVEYLADWEPSFLADVNEDGVVGLNLEEIETNGADHLHLSTDGRYFVETEGTLTQLSIIDAEAGLDAVLAQLSMTQVTADDNGAFLALWQREASAALLMNSFASHAMGSDNELIISHHNAVGQLVETEVVTSVAHAEETFQVDLDDDGFIGTQNQTTTNPNSESLSGTDDGLGLSVVVPILGVLAFAALNEFSFDAEFSA